MFPSIPLPVLEVLVLADETASAKCVATDLLSQAEHDELACATLVTTSEKLAEEVSEWVDKFVAVLPRADIMQKSLDNFGNIFVADNMADAIDAQMILLQSIWKLLQQIHLKQ